jgi:hypothetical protein
MSDEGTIVQKQGEIVAVQPTKTGWTEIHLQETGKQYPYKASTKIEAIIEQAQAGLFKDAVLTAKEVDSGNPNPNRPGFNFINRMAMKVEVGGVLDVAAASAKSPAGGRTDVERGSIERQTIVKAAVPVYKEFADDDLFFAFLDRLSLFVAGSPVVVSEAVTVAPAVAAAAPVASGGAPPADDDSIPFAPAVW